jgi:hypothetical protein
MRLNGSERHLSELHKAGADTEEAFARLTKVEVLQLLRATAQRELKHLRPGQRNYWFYRAVLRVAAGEAQKGVCKYTDDQLRADGRKYSGVKEWRDQSPAMFRAAYRRHLVEGVFQKRVSVTQDRSAQMREHYGYLADLSAARDRPALAERILALQLPAFASMSQKQIERWLRIEWRAVRGVFRIHYPQFVPKYPAPDATLEEML